MIMENRSLAKVRKLSKEVAEQLLGKIIPFWRSLRDDRWGGWYGYVSYELDMPMSARAIGSPSPSESMTS